MLPLRIEAHLAEPAVSYMGIHLDSILAYSVVAEQTQGAMLPETQAYIYVDLPLRQLWKNEAGVPLWASTDLLPEEELLAGVHYLHRRALSPWMTRKNIDTGAGRHKEKRTPMPTLNNKMLVAYAYGDPEHIAQLLSRVTSIGKKHTGRVREWRIEEVERMALVDGRGQALRPLPYQFLFGTERQADHRAIIAYSPPYWHVACRAMCVPTGSVVNLNLIKALTYDRYR